MSLEGGESNEQVPEELSKEYQKDFHNRQGGLNWRKYSLNTARNKRSVESGEYQDFTQEEQEEYDTLDAAEKKVQELCLKASELANITTGIEYIGQRKPGGGVYERLVTKSPIRAERLEAKTHPRVMREMADLYKEAMAELRKFPRYNVKGEEIQEGESIAPKS